MKTMMFLPLTIAYLLDFAGLSAQPEPTLTLVTTIDPKVCTSVLFEPEGGLDVTYWKSDYIQVTIKVEGNGFNRQQVKALIPSGIFKIEQFYEATQLRLTMPGLNKKVSINGEKVMEKVSFVVNLPSTMSLRSKTNATPVSSVQ